MSRIAGLLCSLFFVAGSGQSWSQEKPVLLSGFGAQASRRKRLCGSGLTGGSCPRKFRRPDESETSQGMDAQPHPGREPATLVAGQRASLGRVGYRNSYNPSGSLSQTACGEENSEGRGSANGQHRVARCLQAQFRALEALSRVAAALELEIALERRRQAIPEDRLRRPGRTCHRAAIESRRLLPRSRKATA